MASVAELANEETFFQGVINNPLLNLSYSQDLPETTPSKTKKPRKSKTPKSQDNAEDIFFNLNNPKEALETTPSKKGPKQPRKSKSPNPSAEETFFQGMTENGQLNLPNPEDIPEKSPLKKGRKSKSPAPGAGKTSAKKLTGSEKENSEPKSVENKKSSRKSVKRQPLKELQEGEIRPEVPNVGFELEEAIKEENVSLGKIEFTVEGSEEGASTTNRRNTIAESKRNSTKLTGPPKSIKFRYSMNDFSNQKTTDQESALPFNFEKKAVRPKLLSKPAPRPEEIEAVIANLETLFPQADPEYLRAQCLKLKGSLDDTVELVTILEKKGELPSRADYLSRQAVERLQNKYWENFRVENFLKIIHDPWEYFLILNKHNCIKYADHTFYYLKNKFKKHYKQAIQEVIIRNNYSLYLSHKDLQKKNRILKMRATNRSKFECDAGKPTTFNMQFMHEVAFIENEGKIKTQMRKLEAGKLKRYKQTEKVGGLLDCQSCQESGLLWEDIVHCSANHVFCRDCILEFVDITVENKNILFKCILKCEENIPMESIRDILSPVVLASFVERKKAESKIKEIHDLVCCSYCYYVNVQPPEAEACRCSNPSCKFESFGCSEGVDQIPANRDDVLVGGPKPEVADSTPICFRCKNEFVQGDNSKELVCSCGAIICSICRQPYPDCSHFFDDSPGAPVPREPGSSSDDAEFLEAAEGGPQAEFFDPTAVFQSFVSTDSHSF